MCYPETKWPALAYGSEIASAVKASDSLARPCFIAFGESAGSRELLLAERAPQLTRRNFCFYSKQKFSDLAAEAMLRIGLIR